MNMSSFNVSGRLVDLVAREIFRGTVAVRDGRIAEVTREETLERQYILPGLVDAHIHIESSMLIPSEFARLAVVHGTVATVSDPHEIANVLGKEGVRFMIGNGRKVPFKFFFGAPSCVPATPFETAGAQITVEDIDELLGMEEVKCLSEMMNFPGVLRGDPTVMQKLALAARHGKPVDGHAPGLLGEEAARYAGAGITTDHECYSYREAADKIKYGMTVQIREGSAARNFHDLAALIREFPDRIMFCSDDKHPDELVGGHMDTIVKKAISLGNDPLEVLRIATLNPVKHYSLDVGLLRPGDPADFIIVDDLHSFGVIATYVNGIRVAGKGRSLIGHVVEEAVNRFDALTVTPEDLRVAASGDLVRVMQAVEGQLLTRAAVEKIDIENGYAVTCPGRDILKIVVMNRYNGAKPAVGFIKGFGLKRGALASTVAHDSHNIIAVGTNDSDIAALINLLIEQKGGICVTDGQDTLTLALPFAGIMSGEDGYAVAETYSRLNRMAKNLGSPLAAPFMTLSFMALLVIPELKMSDRGLFDVNTFGFTDLFVRTPAG
jgi:adenine deaminase